MSNDLAQQLLKEMKEMRTELNEVRDVLFSDGADDELEAYDHPHEILQALDEAKKKHGEPSV